MKKGDGGEIRKAFAQALAVRALGPQARDLADRHFFETLVRVHRSGEGAPFTGLKEAGTPVEPAVALADRAVEKESADELLANVGDHVSSGIRERFQSLMEKKKHAGESIDAGRVYTDAYVTFVHYVEGIDTAARGDHGEHAGDHP